MGTRAAGAPTSVAHHFAGAMLFPHGLQLLPLIGRERLPNIEEHVRIGLFEVGAGLRDCVNLGKDLRLIGLIGFDHGMEQRFLLFEVGIEVDQLEPVLQEDVVHLVLLLVCEVELLGELRIVPPAAEVSVVKGALHGRPAEAAFAGTLSRFWSARPKAGSIETLGKGKPGSDQTKQCGD
jgi:hypothetical protein